MRHAERRDQTPATPAAAPKKAPEPVVPAVLALQRAVGNSAVAEIMGEQRFTAHEVLQRPGSPLPDAVRTDMESRLGADFSTVRVHTDTAAGQSAAELGALAYTSGEHIVLGSGGSDRHTVAHELSHVIQQRSGPVSGADNGGGLSVSDPSDKFERAAEETATKALNGAAPTPHPEHAGGQSELAVQRRMNLNSIDNGITPAEEAQVTASLLGDTLLVPVTLPDTTAATTRAQTTNQSRGMSPLLTVNPNNPRLALAELTWRQLLDGDTVRMSAGAHDLRIAPHSGASIAAAITDLLGLRRDPGITGDPVLDRFTTNLMTWLMRRQGGSGGDATVALTPRATADGNGIEVAIENRPGWDGRAGEIVTGHEEDRRHILAWHAMRDAFRRVFNAALAPGEEINDRMQRLIDLLGRADTWADLNAAEEESDTEMADGSTSDGMEVDSQSDDNTPSDQLREQLTASITRLMGQLSNNPFNLWAGDSTANQSINRVGQQLLRDMADNTDDTALLTQVRQRATAGAASRTEDRAVWEEVRNTLEGAEAADVRSIVQSTVDSFDVDIPFTGRDMPSSTYNNSADQIAVVQHTLRTNLAQQLLAMRDGPLPADFDTLITQVGAWLRRFLRPGTLETSLQGGHRVVHRPTP